MRDKQTVEKMIHQRIMSTQLFMAMKSSGRYGSDIEMIGAILEMRDAVREGEDPEEVLFDEGFEPDYVFDLI